MNNFNLFFTEEISNTIVNQTVSEEIKEVVKSIYRKVFRKEMNASCSNCFTDAYFELYNLWKSDIAKFTALFTCEYQLKFGEVLSEFGSSDNIATRVNMTNDLAIMYLSINKWNARLFEDLPEDWEQQVKDYEDSKIVVLIPQVIDEPIIDSEDIPVIPIVDDVAPEVPVIDIAPETIIEAPDEIKNESKQTIDLVPIVEAPDVPDDFPAKEILFNDGYDTIEKIKDCPDFTVLNGIGTATAKLITEYLATI